MTRSIRNIVILTLATFLLTAFIACAPYGGAGTGTLKVLVTDKPYPVDWIVSAEVTVVRVDVRAGTADESEDAQNGDPDEPQQAQEVADGETDDLEDGDDEAFITIFDSEEDSDGDGEADGPKVFDLLDLQNGRMDLLADANIPAGTYTQMRVYVTEGTIVILDEIAEDGVRTFDLTVPSGSSSGIKLHFTFEVLEGEETQLLLDVDLTRAFQAIPSGDIDDPSTINTFKFQPSLAMRLIDLLEAGSIAGTVTAAADGMPVALALVTAYLDGEEVTSTIAEEDGTYVLAGLPAGDYLVEVTAEGFQDAQSDAVAVVAGEETADVNFALTAAAVAE
jgi:hypothetical protein